MRYELTPEELEHRRAVAAEVFAIPAGKELIAFLIDDLGFYDIPESESDMIKHNFALWLFKTYFEVTGDDASHRSFVTEAIIGAPKPPREKDNG